jgi:hypothetical protein
VSLASLLILECTAPTKALELIGEVGSKNWLDDTEVERYVLGLGGLVALACLYRPVRFGLTVGVVLLAGHLWYGQDTGEGARERLLYRDRSFFGVLRVEEQLDSDREPCTRTLMHGSTTHGQQSRDPKERLEPWTYYHRAGPLGEIFECLIDPEQHRELAVIGLGTGTTAAYAEKGQTLTYFEIDPVVRHIAEDPFPFLPPEDPYLFTYVNDARRRGARIDIVLGDARLKLREQNDGRFDLLAVDAFSSDAIPMHLLTKEAFQLYFQKLRPQGILMVHISNRYLELSPVVGNIAVDLGLVARRFNDSDERQHGEYTSEWVAVVRKPEHLGDLIAEDHWETIDPDPLVGVWTDDFSNILSVLTWYRDSRQWLSQRFAWIVRFPATSAERRRQ